MTDQYVFRCYQYCSIGCTADSLSDSERICRKQFRMCAETLHYVSSDDRPPADVMSDERECSTFRHRRYQYCSIGCTADSLSDSERICRKQFRMCAETLHYVSSDDRAPANVMSDERECSTFRHRRYQYCSIGCTADSLNRQSESINVSYVPQWQISMYSDAISTVLLVVRLIAWADSERICCKQFRMCAETFQYVSSDERLPANVMSDGGGSSTFRHRRYQYCSIGCTADSLNRQSESMPQNVSYVPQWQISMYSDAISTVLLVVRLIAWADSERICCKHFRMCAGTLHYVSSDDRPPANVMSDERECSTFRHRRYQYCSIGCTADSLIRQWENMPQNVSYVPQWQISMYSDAISTVLLVVRLIAWADSERICCKQFRMCAETFQYVSSDERLPANVMSDGGGSSTFRHRRYQYCSIGCTADSLNRQSESMPQNVSYVPQWQISMYSDAISTVLLVVRLIAWSDSERICRKMFRTCRNDRSVCIQMLSVLFSYLYGW